MKAYKISLYGRQGSLPVVYQKAIFADSFYINAGDITFMVYTTDSKITNVAAFAKGQWVDVELDKQDETK